ncbi:MAG: hypothetical protein OXF01_04440 [Gemmatimonadetes bacterium]|nr:hypothetical protein [Gemmatimonadota bacterium]
MRSSAWASPFRRVSTGASLCAAALWLLAASAGSAQAQVTAADAVPDSVPAADSVPAGLSPPGAFLRGAIIPGWGHVATGSTTRGAFYFGWESLTGWMIYKSHRRLGAARRQVTLWEDRVTARLLREGVEPESVEAQLERHPEIIRYRGLVDARAEQREDWFALGVFILLLSGVDAFVSTHLRDFPEPLTVEGDPVTGTVEVAFRVPLGRW